METSKKTEDQLIDDIFNIFCQFNEEESSDRNKVYLARFTEAIFYWCKILSKDEVVKIGEEIYKISKRIINKEGKLKIPKDKPGFIKYIKTSLNHSYFRMKQSEKELIHIPKGKKQKLKEIDDTIIMHEHMQGRNLSENEKIRIIAIWFNIPEDKAYSYFDIKNKINISPIYVEFSGETVDISEFNKNIRVPYSYEDSGIIERNYLNKDTAKIICTAVDAVLNGKQRRTREPSRALFTLHCFENVKDYGNIIQVLNKNILNMLKTKKLNQYEIYTMYHPHVNEKSASVRSSEMLKAFLADLEKHLKENNPEIFP